MLLLLLPSIAWQAYAPEAFETAAREHKLVLIDLGAVWCHWCHVMDEVTYRDPAVERLIADHYVAIRVDQDQRPDLAQRYEDYGWPATIVLRPDGTELAKRRGYLPPKRMASMLQAIVVDPTPGPSVVEDEPFRSTGATELSKDQVEALLRRYFGLYDHRHGGWGTVHKFIHADSMEYALAGAIEGDDVLARMARQTLDQNLALLDRIGGGVFQYSDNSKPGAPWASPHYEKILSFQAQNLELYALAAVTFGEPRYRDAAAGIARYLLGPMTSPEGAFYASQDADVSPTVPGAAFYSKDLENRAILGNPRIDRHLYARENGWAIAALARYAGTLGDEAALDGAITAAEWILAHRRRLDGGFAHGAGDEKPYLADDAAMARAFLILYEVTAEPRWLALASEAMTALERFRVEDGYQTSIAAQGEPGVLSTPYRQVDENIAIARLGARLARYTGEARHRDAAVHAMRFLASPTVTGQRRFLIGILLADRELRADPDHITVVGPMSDRAAKGLHRAALALPSTHRRIEWLDPDRGLANEDVRYPRLPGAKAYVCTSGACSRPVENPSDLAGVLARARAR
jgi:hypothetical protein